MPRLLEHDDREPAPRARIHSNDARRVRPSRLRRRGRRGSDSYPPTFEWNASGLFDEPRSNWLFESHPGRHGSHGVSYGHADTEEIVLTNGSANELAVTRLDAVYSRIYPLENRLRSVPAGLRRSMLGGNNVVAATCRYGVARFYRSNQL